MNLSEIVHRSFMVVECPSCQTKDYIFNKLSANTVCKCGYKDVDVLPIKEWTANDFLMILKLEMENNNREDLLVMADDIYDNLNELVEDKKFLRNIINIISDNLCEHLFA